MPRQVGPSPRWTDPDGNLRTIPNSLVSALLERGRIRPDVHRLGLDVDHIGRTRDAAVKPQNSLFAMGSAWEIAAVPDIRRQVWTLARFLTDEHWVGGEGL